MVRVPLAAAILVLLPLAGCATHAGLAAPTAELRALASPEEAQRIRQLEQSMTDTDIAAMLDVKVQPRLPTALAVAKLKSPRPGWTAQLQTIDAQEMAGWEQAIAGQPAIAGVHPVTSLLHGESTPTLRSLRLAAAKMNCELLLVYVQADASVDNYNDAAVLYWTVVGLWLVPGNVYEHRTVMHALLMDSRTGLIIGTASGDGYGKRLYPAMFKSIQEDKLSRQTPQVALCDLQKGASTMLAHLAAGRE